MRLRSAWKRLAEPLALGICATLFGVLVLATLLIDVARDGLPRLDWQFLTSYPSPRQGSWCCSACCSA